MKVCPSRPQGNPVSLPLEILHGAESTFCQSRCNNVQVGAVQPILFLHAKTFPSCAGNSLIEFKKNQSAPGRPFTWLQGESAEMGRCLPTITDKNYSPLLRPSLSGYRPGLHVCSAKGRPSPGPVQRLPMVGFCLPNKKESGMSQHAPSQFLLSG